MSKHPIVIIGFMGSGKTTVARELAAELGVQFVDVDELITEQQRRTPAQIITDDGEQRFREIETDQLRQALDSSDPAVIAAGGGAWTIEANRKLISDRQAVVIWLNAPFELCWTRIKQADCARPMAPSREAAAKLYEARKPIYALADLAVSVSHRETPQQIAKKITVVLKDNSNS